MYPPDPDIPLNGTKLSVLLAAGELFARHGLDGASVRAIAEKADANIAAVNYHFGSKEHLYLEALKHVAKSCLRFPPEYFLSRARAARTPEDMAIIIGDMVRARFQGLLPGERPQWYSQLVMRSFLEPPSALRDVVHQYFHPEHETLCMVIRMARPDMQEEDALMHCNSILAQAVFYAFLRTPLLIQRGWDDYPAGYLERACRHVIELTLRALDLPCPPAACDITHNTVPLGL